MTSESKEGRSSELFQLLLTIKRSWVSRFGDAHFENSYRCGDNNKLEYVKRDHCGQSIMENRLILQWTHKPSSIDKIKDKHHLIGFKNLRTRKGTGAFPRGTADQNSPASAGDRGLIPVQEDLCMLRSSQILSPRSEPESSCNCWVCAEACPPGACARQQEEPAQRAARTAQLERGPRQPQVETAHVQRQRPSAAKHNSYVKFSLYACEQFIQIHKLFQNLQRRK